MAKCAAVPADPAANDLAGLNPKTDSFDVGGDGIGLFEDPLVEPLITAFLRHFLLDHRTRCLCSCHCSVRIVDFPPRFRLRIGRSTLGTARKV